MDLRCHGDSPFVNEPATMRDFAMDVYETLTAHHIPIDTVGCPLLRRQGGDGADESLLSQPSLSAKDGNHSGHIRILHESLPSPHSMIGSISDEATLSHIDSVIDAIDGVQRPIPNYTYLKKELLRQGLKPAIADWLTTSVRWVIHASFTPDGTLSTSTSSCSPLP